MRFLFLMVLLPAGLSAQTIIPFTSVIATAGGSEVVKDQVFTYTVGEHAIFTLTGMDRTLTQGFNQPEAGIVVGLANSTLAKELGLTIFPNPTTEFLNIQATVSPNGVLLMTDSKGTLILQKTWNAKNLQIPCGNLPEGTYFLRFQTKDNRVLSLPFQKL